MPLLHVRDKMTEKEITSRLDSIEKMIQEHAIGVQRVYDEMALVRNRLNMNHVEQLLKQIEEVSPEVIQKRIEDMKKIINSDESAAIISKFDDFKKSIENLYESVCRY